MDKLAVGVTGALGNMGRMVCFTIMRDPDLDLAAAVDPAYAEVDAEDFPPRVPHYFNLTSALAESRLDVLVDFTRPDTVLGNTLAALQAGVSVVVGTTGLTAADLEQIEQVALEKERLAFVAPNFALGAVLMMRFAADAGRYLHDCEIIELHHTGKLDAPSGTAKRTAMLIREAREYGGEGFFAEPSGGQEGEKVRETPIPIHSVRLPGLVAHQEIIFGGVGETLTIRHDSLSRECFMPGVLLAVKQATRLQGLIVGLENIL